MTAQAATQEAPATVPITLGRIALQERSTGPGEPTIPRWAMSVAERRAIWLRMKHPKMNARKRALWAENAQSKTAPSCSSR
jgi:hypothetical protein